MGGWDLPLLRPRDKTRKNQVSAKIYMHILKKKPHKSIVIIAPNVTSTKKLAS